MLKEILKHYIQDHHSTISALLWFFLPGFFVSAVESAGFIDSAVAVPAVTVEVVPVCMKLYSLIIYLKLLFDMLL